MRTAPLKKWKKEPDKFDKLLWEGAQSILGLQISEQIWKQVCLTPRLGGLGLWRIRSRRNCFLSELARSQSHLRRARHDTNWSLSQKAGSFEEILQQLIEEAPNQRERQRLTRLKCEH